MVEKELLTMALEPDERAELERLEVANGLRRLVAYGIPSPDLGLSSSHTSGPLAPRPLQLTTQGRTVFPYLNGSLPVDPGSWAHFATPADPEFQPLVSGPEDEALVGICRRHDGREVMIQTFDAGSAHVQGNLLRPGQLEWLTHGTYAGLHRRHLTVHVDDVLLANHSWRVDRHETDRRPQSVLRMKPRDVDAAASWSRSRGIKLSMVCNGAGANWNATADQDRGPDALLSALLAEREAFGWINHTFSHANLAELTQAEIETEILRNQEWAAGVGIELEEHVLVSGEHSGLADLTATPIRPANPQFAAALGAARIRYVACDASKPYPGQAGRLTPPGTPFAVGGALAVPRRPTVLPHDAATPSQTLDQLRRHGARWNSFGELAEAEARRIFNLVAAGDALPHVFHQSNLIGAVDATTGEQERGIALEVLELVLDRARTFLSSGLSLAQETMAEIGLNLTRLHGWRYAEAAGHITATIDEHGIRVNNTSPGTQMLPLTGARVGESCDGTRSGWVCVKPGETVFERADRASALAGTGA